MTIKDWPSRERPREKLLHHGPAALSDAELLAILLRSGRRGQDVVSLARSALATLGGLRGLLEAPPAGLSRAGGLGPTAYATLSAALELSRRYLYATLERDGPLENPDAASHYLVARMKAYRREVFGCLFLDTRHRVITFRELFYGSIDSATVHPREVVSACLELNAAALILAHNHPSGVAEPSGADTAITRRIVDAARLIDVRVLDHLVVGEREAVSMAARGLL
ncbi:MAG: DNA repair protein RadC [Gammaproteobacteria bacterium]|nr:DNA repair protein RadC [Gammaproteobacteria bacterium]MCP5200518.1 DNA repair protein RadC [Gammaproteobacteria bacterium]